MRPLPTLPMPVAHGNVGLLWQHTNIPAHSRVMVLAWLLDCFRPDTLFPVLELVGEQGSAKSTTQSVLRSLVDPNKVMLRGRPKTVEDVFFTAANNWLVSYECSTGRGQPHNEWLGETRRARDDTDHLARSAAGLGQCGCAGEV